MKFLVVKKCLPFLLIGFVLIFPLMASAQFDDLPATPDAPIDGGLSLLVAAGVGYGAKKIKEKRNKRAEEPAKG